MIFYYINQIIPVSGITLSGFHCTFSRLPYIYSRAFDFVLSVNLSVCLSAAKSSALAITFELYEIKTSYLASTN